MSDSQIVSASLDIEATGTDLFELIADPSRQPSWDGNMNLREAAEGQRVRQVGDVFTMVIHTGAVRENRIVEFEEGHRIAWMPNEPGLPAPGHLWRWELEPLDDGRTRVTHTYDWTRLVDETRLLRARSTGRDQLMASLLRLSRVAQETSLADGPHGSTPATE